MALQLHGGDNIHSFPRRLLFSFPFYFLDRVKGFIAKHPIDASKIQNTASSLGPKTLIFLPLALQHSLHRIA